MDTPLLSRRMWLALTFTGMVAGCVGIVLTHLLHAIQQLMFLGYLSDEHISFRQLVQAASPTHRFWALLACGAVVGIAWTCLHRYGAPLRDIKSVVKQPAQTMPIKTTLCHALLQIITVGMGSPLGREVAPREMSVALATPIAQRLTLNDIQKSWLFACASGAGLAAVYNVPLAATVFILETLLLTWNTATALAALWTCCVAVFVVRLGLGDTVQYAHLPTDALQPINTAMLLWAIVAGIVLAIATWAFAWCQKRLPKIAPNRWIMLPTALLCFAIIGAMSMYYPEILGNGKAGNQLTFADQLNMQAAWGLFVSKWIAIFLATLAGAYGGRITPSMMLGSTLALLCAVAWNSVLPPIPVGVAAFIGAAVFLGIAQNMCLTAIVFLLELSRQSTALWLPMCLCMAVAVAVRQMWLKNP